uniref:Zinc finger C2HC domain-containing protein 1A n=1 Tax=Gouania willdenowi TaxID=441366 RepID=A0A8C5DE21_GOUWI
AALGTEISVLKPTKPKDKSNNIQCPYCQRRFNESAADRHIKFCKEIHARMPNKGKPGGAKKLAGSTTYRTPAAVKKINTAIVAPANKPQVMSSGYGSEFEDGAAPPSVDLVQCNSCERRFFPKVWEKHIVICQKLMTKKRKVFDSRKQRTGGK